MTATDTSARSPDPSSSDRQPGISHDGYGAGARAAADVHGLTLEKALWLLVVAVAAGLRLLALAATPLMQVEGARALQTLRAAQGSAVEGWPGGIVDALTAAVFKIFGASDAGARVVPAAAGVALVASLWLLRPCLGRGATLVAAAFAAASPCFIVDARAADGQAAGAAMAVVLAWLVLRLLAAPRPRTLVAIAAVAAFGLGTDAVFIAALLLLGAWLAVRAATGDEALRAAWSVAARQEAWLPSALPLASGGLLLAFSRFGLGFARLRPGAMAAWSLAFSPVASHAPWHYAFDVLVGYEAPLLFAGLVGVCLIVRSRSWRRNPMHSLLLVWVSGGVALDLFMAARQPSTLLLTVLPLALLGGHAVSCLCLSFRRGRCDTADLAIAAGLLAALGFSLVAAGRSLQVTVFGALPEIWFGATLVAMCCGAAVYRWRAEGPRSAAPVVAVLAFAALFVDLHGAGSTGFNGGDEFIQGLRTTSEGVAQAQLLTANGGGVSSVTDAALPPLAWYLRDTIRSGGHGLARLIAPETPVPAGFHVAGATTLVARSWWPSSFSPEKMVRWWVYREAWGPTQDVTVMLVVED